MAVIMKNTTLGEDPAQITEAVNKMKTEIMAGLYHTIEHTARYSEPIL